MEEKLWQFISATGDWWSKSYGLPPMTGRVFAWLLVCDPPEQTAAELADELEASKGSISSATGMLVRARLIERLRIRGERADRFRMRPNASGEQLRDPGIPRARELLAHGLDALKDAPAKRRERLEEVDAFYAWWQSRSDALVDEWVEYNKRRLERDE
jgi:DNA-binding MarR family transcriptional regulator